MSEHTINEERPALDVETAFESYDRMLLRAHRQIALLQGQLAAARNPKDKPQDPSQAGVLKRPSQGDLS